MNYGIGWSHIGFLVKLLFTDSSAYVEGQGEQYERAL